MDTLANLLTSLRNAQLARHTATRVPDTKLNKAILEVLVKTGYLSGVISVDATFPTLQATFAADRPMEKIRLISKRGRRVYVSADKIPVIRYGRGMVVLSTNAGVMPGHEAYKKKLGGELLCEVY